ncbi:MAG: site-2 protease family protein [Clostridia bacterium]|nr:site-2 protease family protein [Clostridia bacterium]
MYFDTRYLYIVLAILAISSIVSGGFDLLSLLLTLPGVLIAITFHEFAHAFAADKLGDDTPRNQGRLSLNPFDHLDPFGLVMLIFAHIGWGKPVQINPRNFTRKVSMKTGEAIVSLAGPLMNFILAIVFSLVFYAVQVFAASFCTTETGLIVLTMIQYIVIVNIGLGVFNLIPLPPLDGSKILVAFLPYNAQRWVEEHEQLFYIIFLIIWITPISSMIISPAIDAIAKGLDYMAAGIFSLFI